MLPLLHSNNTALLVRQGGSVSRQEFLARAHKLAAAMPASQHYFNLCQGRDNFILALAAGLMAGKTALLPPSKAPELLGQLAERYATQVVLSDVPEPAPNKAQQLDVAAYWEGDSDSQVLNVPHILAEHIAVIPFTSGSTGEPAAHPKRWADLVRENEMACERLFALPNAAPLSIVATVPPQHMYGLEATVLTALHGNCQVHAARPMLPAEVARALAEVPEPRVLVSTPAHLRVLLGAQQAYPSLAKAISATAPLSPSLAMEIETAWDTEVHEIYGCTEAGSIASRRSSHDSYWRPYSAMAITACEQGFRVSGPQLAEPVQLSDQITLLQNGQFQLRGRDSDLVNVAGKRASLADLTLKLQAIDGVEDAVIVQPNADHVTGRLAALVVAPTLTQKEVRAAMRQHFDAVFLPRPLRLVAALPRNETGKLPRQAVLNMLRPATREA